MRQVPTHVPPFLRVNDGKAEMVVSAKINGEVIDVVAPIHFPANWCRDVLVALAPLIGDHD